MVLDEFLFLDSSSTEFSNEYNVGNSEQLLIQVEKIGQDTVTFNLSVYGRADDDGDNHALSGINMGNLSTASSITAAGIYCYSIAGMKKIKVKNEASASYGKIKVFGRIM